MLAGLNETELLTIIDNQFTENYWMEYRSGNILEETDLDYIVHQANCFHCMGAGVAGALAKKWPIVAKVDKEYTPYGVKEKMGTYTEVTINEPDKKQLKVINLYSQFAPGCATSMQDIKDTAKAIETGLIELREQIINVQASRLVKGAKYYIGFPWLIACGIYGMDVNEVYGIIKSVFYDYSDIIKVVFVEFGN
jgi:O-acetyl-ADP-ribose deacetylase (regulator of RNase III)